VALKIYVTPESKAFTMTHPTIPQQKQPANPEYTELQRTGSTEGLKRWTMAFPRTSEDVVDEVLVSL